MSKNTFLIISEELTVGSTLLISQMKRDIYTVHLMKKYANYLICIFNHMHTSYSGTKSMDVSKKISAFPIATPFI